MSIRDGATTKRVSTSYELQKWEELLRIRENGIWTGVLRNAEAIGLKRAKASNIFHGAGKGAR
jgi:hypothetical protein